MNEITYDLFKQGYFLTRYGKARMRYTHYQDEDLHTWIKEMNDYCTKKKLKML